MIHTSRAPDPAPGTAVADIQVGDILLMRSAGDFSAVVAWLGESQYSHAAIATGPDTVAEAITAGVLTTRIDELLQLDIEHIDLYRPCAHDGTPFDDDDRASIAACAGTYLGHPYAKYGLVVLGMWSALRNAGEIPVAWQAAVNLALRVLLDDGGRTLICSELVYRSLSECQVEPVGRLRPRILQRTPNPLPLPDVDPVKLMQEIAHMLGWDKARADAGLLATAGDVQATAQLHARARAMLGLPAAADDDIDGGARLFAGKEPVEDPRPVPRLVRPREFEVSPSVRLVGRLK
ncbi:hypothetical protein LDO26_01725 [Luteimonas sp. BDR2-5]|uniref:hypothetical protein n=1 Tax=Proluteimonas luteida TaxID=2878685 RepID=UPI001E57614A|nr:hypothetical protein [Luteimonas sp. BDR2-5]MCD9026934.1 hypothetical protein [Luteimonas sp. BDR2-5]